VLVRNDLFNQFSRKDKERNMFQKSKITRTLIADLPEIDVELTESDLRSVFGGQANMRIVSGGLTNGLYSCNTQVKSASAKLAQTNVATGQDWDTDY
jgi:hypothetical protein